MEMKQNPFSFYDFLGYLTPGAIFLYGAMAAYRHSLADTLSVEQIAALVGLDKAEAYVPLILLAYAVGHLLNFISSITIERYSLWAMGYPSKYLLGVKHGGYFGVSDSRALHWVIRCLVFILILPVSAMDLVLGKVLRLRGLYAKKLDDLLIKLITAKVYSLMRKKGGLKNPSDHGKAHDTDFFHFAYHYAVENAPNHFPKMQNYVALYGFLRTLTLLSVLLFWAVVWHVYVGTMSLTGSAILLALLLINCYLFFMAFVKFYRRFSLEALMAISVVYVDDPQN